MPSAAAHLPSRLLPVILTGAATGPRPRAARCKSAERTAIENTGITDAPASLVDGCGNGLHVPGLQGAQVDHLAADAVPLRHLLCLRERRCRAACLNTGCTRCSTRQPKHRQRCHCTPFHSPLNMPARVPVLVPPHQALLFAATSTAGNSQETTAPALAGPSPRAFC